MSFVVSILALAGLLGGCAVPSGAPGAPGMSIQAQSMQTLDQASRHGTRG